MRDSQRSAVYNWENTLVREKYGTTLPQPMSLEECKTLIQKVWRDYRGISSNPPYVKDGRGTRWARGCRAWINLPRWSRTVLTVLHEIAHALQYEGAPWHQ